MKFYDCATAPSPRRVRIFLAEKGLTVPTEQVDLRKGEQFTPSFRALNPDCTVPVLELDSGAAITDTDISGLVAVDLSARAKLEQPEYLGHLQRWYKDVSTRPSAKA
jgi:Glutathione S-transferase, N-terminal domain